MNRLNKEISRISDDTIIPHEDDKKNSLGATESSLTFIRSQKANARLYQTLSLVSGVSTLTLLGESIYALATSSDHALGVGILPFIALGGIMTYLSHDSNMGARANLKVLPTTFEPRRKTTSSNS